MPPSENIDISVVYQQNRINLEILEPGRRFLHSSRDPHREADRQADQIIEALKGSPVPVLIGCGAGYVLESLRTKDPEFLKKLLVFEPLTQLTQNTELQIQLGKKNFVRDHYLTSQHDLNRAVQKADRHANVFVHPVYRRYFPELIDTILSQFQSKQSNTNLDTRQRFTRSWINNTLRHIYDNQELSFISPLEKPGINTDVYAVVFCGAGPTLIDDLNILGIHPGFKYPKLFLIASDTSLPLLLKKGYDVDLCISVDAGPGTWYHYATLDSDLLPLEIPLLGWLGGPVCAKLYFNSLVYYRSTLPLDQLLALGPLAHLTEWQNPSNNQTGLALLVAHSFSVPNVILPGCSFERLNGLTHISGSGYQYFSRLNTKRLNNMVLYQPGGYSGTSKKNISAKEGLAYMAENLNIKILDIEQHKNYIDQSQNSKALGLQFRKIKCTALKSFLSENWKDIDKDVWRSLGMRTDYLDKVNRFLVDNNPELN